MSVSVRTGDGMDVSSGKITSDGRDASFGKVLSSFSTTKYEFLPLCGLFSSLLTSIRSHSQSSNCSVVNDSTVFKMYLRIEFSGYLFFSALGPSAPKTLSLQFQGKGRCDRDEVLKFSTKMYFKKHFSPSHLSTPALA